jgi:hypothetical protein
MHVAQDLLSPVILFGQLLFVIMMVLVTMLDYYHMSHVHLAIVIPYQVDVQLLVQRVNADKFKLIVELLIVVNVVATHAKHMAAVFKLIHAIMQSIVVIVMKDFLVQM